MEPAADRRGAPNFLDSQGYFFEPQWSPPVTGGTTIGVNAANNDAIRPQWSPSVTGGKIGPSAHQAGGNPAAAMEPTGDRQDTRIGLITADRWLLPQWSPTNDRRGMPVVTPWARPR
jgi:hypothetical protein